MGWTQTEEAALAQLVSENKSYNEIAAILDKNPKTVANHAKILGLSKYVTGHDRLIQDKEILNLSRQGLTQQAIGNHLALSESSVGERLRAMRHAPTPALPEHFPASTARIYDEEPVVLAERAVLISDTEVPYHDAKLLDIAYHVGKTQKADTLIVVGDFLSGEALSPFTREVDSYVAFRKELRGSKEVLKRALEWFERIYVIPGNHDWRPMRKTDGEIRLADLFDGFSDQVLVTDYRQLTLWSGGEEFLCCHPDSARKVRGSTPLQIANNNLMHVIMGHTHRQNLTFHDSGRFVCVEIGHCTDEKRRAYRAIKKDVQIAWNPGFCLVQDGWPHLINPRNYGMFV